MENKREIPCPFYLKKMCGHDCVNSSQVNENIAEAAQASNLPVTTYIARAGTNIYRHFAPRVAVKESPEGFMMCNNSTVM